MQRAAASRDQHGVGYLLRERVLENPGALVALRLFVEELEAPQLGQGGVDPAGVVDHRAEQSLRHLAAEHGSRQEHVLGPLGEPVDARGEDALHGVGNGEPARRPDR